MMSESAIAEFNEFESNLQEFKNKYVGVVYDLDDEKQNKLTGKKSIKPRNSHLWITDSVKMKLKTL
jgi:hypothetical protein